MKARKAACGYCGELRAVRLDGRFREHAGTGGRRCAGGGRVDYRTYPGRDHVGLIAPDSPLIPDLIQWTHDRLDGKTAGSTCPG